MRLFSLVLDLQKAPWQESCIWLRE